MADLVNHTIHHPNGSRAHETWAQDRTLHVAVAYNNPYRWKARLHLFNDFRRHMACLPNVKLYVGEIAYGERPFEVTSPDHPLDFQFRTREVLWHKENLLNQVVARFDPGWQYGAYIDGDMNFSRHNIALETIHLLQLHEWVQMFSSLVDLGPNHEPIRIFKSFAKVYEEGGLDGITNYNNNVHVGKQGVGATGGAWAFRREAFNACGGFLDTCILGSGDWHMAYGLIGAEVPHPDVMQCSPEYADSIRKWQKRATTACRKNIGCVNVHVSHFWHSSRHRRGYGTRWKILRDNHFNPYEDIYRDSNNLYQLEPSRIKLRDEIRRYFRSRVEDDISLTPMDHPM